ncbi:RHS repeat-associated core domain-containing protein [Granulicella sp. S190]|uniref:RHS repeat-associated core domain-containing protein n=1 Tax=Granulicella sp. S190 TaxID=1747226 RepID=UPI00131CE7C5
MVSQRHFTGKERDAESGLDNFGARYFGSNMGRFMSPDPGIPSPLHLLNPQRWNMYSYGLNNPLSYTDSTGMDAAAGISAKKLQSSGIKALCLSTPTGLLSTPDLDLQAAVALLDQGQSNHSLSRIRCSSILTGNRRPTL